jgi:transcriptional regulator with XRE-family HTH domain
VSKEQDALNYVDQLIDCDITSGKVIKARRLTLGLTQSNIAEMTGMKTTFISAIENDKRTLGVQSAIRLAVAIGLHPSSILFPNGVEMDSELKLIERKRKSITKIAG